VADTRRLLCCVNYRREFSTILAELAIEAEVAYFGDFCAMSSGCPKQKMSRRAEQWLAQSAELDCFISDGCPNFYDNVQKHDNFNLHRTPLCLSWLLNQTLVEEMLARGAYLLSPGWLDKWEFQVMKRWKFDKVTARQFFSESAKELVLLDTGVYGDCTKKMLEFSAYVDIPWRIVPVGLEHLQLHLERELLRNNLRLEREKIKDQSRQNADYAMLVDITGKISQLTTQEDAINEIFSTVTMLTGAAQLAFIPVQSGKIGTAKTIPQAFACEAITNLEINEGGGYRMLANDASFRLYIRYHGDLLGVLDVYEIPLPKFISHYLKLLRFLAGVFALALDNARKYEKILEDAEHLATAKEQAEAANLAKGKFLANMSHELKTPLNGIISMTEMALSSHDDAEKCEYLLMANYSGKTLLKIINDILEYSRMVSGKMALENTNFSLKALANEVFNLTKAIAFQKEISFHLIYDDAIPDELWGDAFRIKQVLLNLLGNAVKFTDRGKVILKIKLLLVSSDQIALKFFVIDTGVGIAVSDVGDLFKDFSQVGNVYSKKMSGTGLGLSISKKIVQMMGGQIGVKSRLGKGSCFSFDIHLSQPSAVSASNPREEKTKLTQFSGRILLVDDDPVGLIYGKKLLTKAGMGIDTAENGTSALQACRNNYYDVIFLDIQMPDIDGYEVAKEIRLMEKKSGLRSVIIALTAYSLQDEAEQCRQHGIDDLLGKPMRLDEVMEKINFWKT